MFKYILQETDSSLAHTYVQGEELFVMNDERKAIHELGKEEFKKLLSVNLTGIDLIANVYKIFDQLNKDYLKEHPIACRSNCNLCCHQLVSCSSLEMQLIEKRLKHMPRKQLNQIKGNAQKQCGKFYETREKLRQTEPNEQAVVSMLAKIWNGHESCHYLLRNGNCGIYPVRPIDCRTARVRVRCGGEGLSSEDDLNPLRLVVDQVVSDIMMEESVRLDGRNYVMPLVFWPISKKFYNIFKVKILRGK